MSSRTRFVVYARVSTGLEDQKVSFKTQVTDLKKSVILTRPEFQCVDVYQDYAISGTREDRPEFQKMIADAKQGKFEYICCKSISRFARNNLLLLQTLKELKECGVEVFFFEEGLDTAKTDAKLLIQFLGAIAEIESTNLKEHLKEGFNIRRAAGKPAMPHQVCYGYDYKDGKALINEKEAEVVKQVFTWFVDENLSTGTIARLLTQKGVLSSRGRNYWSRTAVNYMLKNEKYCGTIIEHDMDKKKVRKTFTFENALPQIIPQEKFERAQEIFEKRNSLPKSQKMRDRSVQNFRASLYPLSQKCFCSVCGGKATRYSTHAELPRRAYPLEDDCNGQPVWGCLEFSGSRSRPDFCPTYMISEEVIYRMLIEAISYISLHKDFMRKAIENLTVEAKINSEYEQALKSYDAQVQDLKQRIDTELKIARDFPTRYDEAIANAKKYERQLSRLQKPTKPETQEFSYQHLEKFINEVKNFSSHDKLVEHLTNAFKDPEVKRSIVTGLVEKITIGGEPKYKIEISFYGFHLPVQVVSSRRAPYGRRRRITAEGEKPARYEFKIVYPELHVKIVSDRHRMKSLD